MYCIRGLSRALRGGIRLRDAFFGARDRHVDAVEYVRRRVAGFILLPAQTFGDFGDVDGALAHVVSDQRAQLDFQYARHGYVRTFQRDGAVRAVGGAVFEICLVVARALHGADDERVGILGEYVRAVKDELTRAAFALTTDEFQSLLFLRKS